MMLNIKKMSVECHSKLHSACCSKFAKHVCFYGCLSYFLWVNLTKPLKIMFGYKIKRKKSEYFALRK